MRNAFKTLESEVRRMAQKGGRTEAYILLILTITINALIIYGFVSKPIIAYHLTTPLEYNGSINMGLRDLHVTLVARNRGDSSAKLDFAVRIYNLSVTGPGNLEVSPNDDFTLIKIPLKDPIFASGERDKKITLKNDGDADYLVLVFSLETRRSLNPVTGFFGSFEVQQPERPTALLLKRIEPGVYKRVTQR